MEGERKLIGFEKKRGDMEAVLFEDQVQYDLWLKVLLALSILVLVAIGILFYTDSTSRDILPGETAKESRYGASVIFAAIVLECLIYWVVLPRKIYICQKRVRLKYGFFYYSVPFNTIQSASVSRGIALGAYVSFLTSFKHQIEIVRKKGMSIRFSPTRVDLFLETLNLALSDWMRLEQNGKIH
jgi:hypothetical protein